MAVRTFLKLTDDGEGDLQEMTSAEMDALKKLTVREFAQNIPVSLQRVTSSGSLGNFVNSYLVPGSAVSTSSSFRSQGDTPDVSEITNTVSHLNETTESQSAPVDTQLLAFPIFLNGTDIQTCSLQDMIDTIWGPAIDLLTASSEDYTSVGGTYAVYKSGQAPSNTTLVSADRVFRDTRNNADYSTNEDVPFSTSGSETTIEDWFLYKFDTPPVPEVSPGNALVYPLKLTQSGDAIRPFTSAEFDPLMEEGVRYTARNATGYRLSYNINGSGTQKGQSITDSRQTASRYIQDQDGDTYYTQEVPNGSISNVRTYTLKLNKS